MLLIETDMQFVDLATFMEFITIVHGDILVAVHVVETSNHPGCYYKTIFEDSSVSF